MLADQRIDLGDVAIQCAVQGVWPRCEQRQGVGPEPSLQQRRVAQPAVQKLRQFLRCPDRLGAKELPGQHGTAQCRLYLNRLWRQRISARLG